MLHQTVQNVHSIADIKCRKRITQQSRWSAIAMREFCHCAGGMHAATGGRQPAAVQHSAAGQGHVEAAGPEQAAPVRPSAPAPAPSTAQARTSAGSFYGRPRAVPAVPSSAAQPGSGGAAAQQPPIAGTAKRSGVQARLEAKLGLRARGSVVSAAQAARGGGGRAPKQAAPAGGSAFEAAFGGVVGALDVRDCSTRCLIWLLRLPILPTATHSACRAH